MGESCRREGRGETEREREPEGEGKGKGNGNSALVAGNRRLCPWGPGRSPGRKTNFMYLGVTKHFWLIDNLIYKKGLWVDLTSSGGEDFPHLAQLGDSLSPFPLLWKALDTMRECV